MSIKRAANFASKMSRENQHTFYQCCRIAADHYKVSATDIQKELASRGGTSGKGRKYSYVVVYRVPLKKVKRTRRQLDEHLIYDAEPPYFIETIKTSKPSEVIKSNERIYPHCEEDSVHCKKFDNYAKAKEFENKVWEQAKRDVEIIEESKIKSTKRKTVKDFDDSDGFAELKALFRDN